MPKADRRVAVRPDTKLKLRDLKLKLSLQMDREFTYDQLMNELLNTYQRFNSMG